MYRTKNTQSSKPKKFIRKKTLFDPKMNSMSRKIPLVVYFHLENCLIAESDIFPVKSTISLAKDFSFGDLPTLGLPLFNHHQ